MDRPTAYHDDIYAWSQEQAAALRALAATRRDLPNVLDIEHVAEEIEDVGRSELRTVESFLELLLRHVLKMASVPEARAARHWRQEIAYYHRSLVKDLANSLRQLIDIESLWQLAQGRAEAALQLHGSTLLTELPDRCPFSLDELVTEPLDLETLVKRLSPSRPDHDEHSACRG